jgi:hypothetical protein
MITLLAYNNHRGCGHDNCPATNDADTWQFYAAVFLWVASSVLLSPFSVMLISFTLSLLFSSVKYRGLQLIVLILSCVECCTGRRKDRYEPAPGIIEQELDTRTK